MEGRSKMGYKLRRIVVSKYMTLFGLRACPMEKAFPGKKQWEEMNAKEEKGDKTIKADVTKSTVKDNWTKITDSSQNSLVSGMIFMKKRKYNCFYLMKLISLNFKQNHSGKCR